ncbi:MULTISPECIES: I78 family peptidase inhibitor [unclassified Streptomyces]|uniref:I78 family peptidase inhibitor n=1 Tax=unclassified Streptomyces TaxID=2593676 RepID=UPI0018FE3FEB|nr:MULTISPECIES: I78 family peptidase inhibitor [unclassified Streptomyces]WSA36985.1 I78 family peptidase inhibitor [Streptomyces sp. NBC_01808]
MATPPNLPTPSPNPDDDPENYVGLAAADAEERARDRGWTTVRSLPPGAIITMEFMGGRLNFTVQDGRVTRSWVG